MFTFFKKLKVCGGLLCRLVVRGRLRQGRSRPTGLARRRDARRLCRLVSSSYADGKRLYVQPTANSLNYLYGVDLGLHGSARPINGLAESPDAAKYAKCRYAQRDRPINRVSTSALRANRRLRQAAGHDIAMPQRLPCRVMKITRGGEETGEEKREFYKLCVLRHCEGGYAVVPLEPSCAERLHHGVVYAVVVHNLD